jgi:recombinational DNA repair protein (RecF pathway)
MLWADARSVRLEKSRQRNALADFSLVRLSLVRGKSGWKIGSVVPMKNFYHSAINQAARGSVVQLVRLLRRYVQGEAADEVLFTYIVSALDTVVEDLRSRQFVDTVVTLTVLSSLGYVACTPRQQMLIDLSPDQLANQYDADMQKEIIAQLQTAEAASQL